MADHYKEADQAPIASDDAPAVIAYKRSYTIADGTASAAEQGQFLAEFGQAFQGARQGVDMYHHWRRIQGNDAWVAGYIEGVAAARRKDLPPVIGGGS